MTYKFSELESLVKAGLSPYIEKGKIKIKVQPPVDFKTTVKPSLKEQQEVMDAKIKEIDAKTKVAVKP